MALMRSTASSPLALAPSARTSGSKVLWQEWGVTVAGSSPEPAVSLPLASLARRSVLAFPLLLGPASARPAQADPPFPHWIGRTTLLSSDGGAARLLLNADGTGLLAVRFFLLCRALPIRAWQFGGDGLSLRYSRVSARDPARLIAGEAHILPDEGQLLWIEAKRRIAVFEGFAAPEAATGCF